MVVDEKDLLLDVENPGDSRPDPNTVARKVAYTGIAVYSPEILDFLPAGVSHATVAWIEAAKAGTPGSGASMSPALTGTTSERRRRTSPACSMRLSENGEMVYLSPTADCGKIGIDGYVVHGIGKRGPGPGAAPKLHRHVRRCSLGQTREPDHRSGLCHRLKETEMQPSLHAGSKRRSR